MYCSYIEDGNDEGIYLAKPANIVRRDILDSSKQIDETFGLDFQKEFVPTTLLALVSMILNGSSSALQKTIRHLNNSLA